MTLTERIQAAHARAGIPPCAVCALRHRGAAWTPRDGWHDAPDGMTVDALMPPVSPFVRRAIAGELPASDRTAGR